MTSSFGLKNSLKMEVWSNQKIKWKMKYQCPQLQFFPLNEADWKGKRQMTDLELWRFEERLDPQTTVQKQLDRALDWMNLADHFATALAFENQALANKMDELRDQL
jgi:hypothetical protein